MEDISLHILDIAENSLRAGAHNIIIRVMEQEDTLTLEIEDDGIGMNGELIRNATNPFFTTKDGKKFGLGLALLTQAAHETGGEVKIENCKTKGLKISASFNMDNIDSKPLGDLNKTMRVLKATHPEINFMFEHIIKNGETT